MQRPASELPLEPLLLLVEPPSVPPLLLVEPELLLVEPRRQGRPGGVDDHVAVVELVGRPHQVLVDAFGLATGAGQRRHLVLGQPGGFADGEVVAPLVVRSAVGGGPQDQHLALSRREGSAGQEQPAELGPPLQQARVMGERGEQVQVLRLRVEA